MTKNTHEKRIMGDVAENIENRKQRTYKGTVAFNLNTYQKLKPAELQAD